MTKAFTDKQALRAELLSQKEKQLRLFAAELQKTHREAWQLRARLAEIDFKRDSQAFSQLTYKMNPKAVFSEMLQVVRNSVMENNAVIEAARLKLSDATWSNARYLLSQDDLQEISLDMKEMLAACWEKHIEAKQKLTYVEDALKKAGYSLEVTGKTVLIEDNHAQAEASDESTLVEGISASLSIISVGSSIN